jgi:hypothetical protein
MGWSRDRAPSSFGSGSGSRLRHTARVSRLAGEKSRGRVDPARARSSYNWKPEESP